MRPQSCTMMERALLQLLDNPSTRSCYTHRPDTTRPGKGNESDPVVAWSVLQHTLDCPKSGSQQPLAPAFVTGLVVSAADILQVWFPAHWAPVVLQQLQQKEDSYRAENPSWMDQEEAPADILKQWQEATDVCSSRLATIEMVTG